MNCIKHKPVGSGGCCKGTVTQASCHRKAKHTRKTSSGAILHFCNKCDEAFGNTVGTKVEVVKLVLKNEWCRCNKPEFHSYPEDGECECGLFQHHVHCANCGCITQVG